MQLLIQTRRLMAPFLFLAFFANVPALAVERRGDITPSVDVNSAQASEAVVSSKPIISAELSEILRLAKNGANQLALLQMDSLQPKPEIDAEQWLRWERERIGLYLATKNWQAMADRIQSQQTFIPPESQQWFLGQQIDAWLALGQGQLARNSLRRLLWSQDDLANDVTIAAWRTGIIRSYLLDGQASAAHTAMLRYAQDYPNANEVSETKAIANSALLRARVLLQANRPADALEILRDKKSRAAQSLRLLAALRHASLSSAEVISKAKKVLASKKLEKPLRLRLLNIIAEASKIEGDNEQTIWALETLLALTQQKKIDDGLFVISGAQLWQAYIEYAQVIGNAQQLLVGDDISWLTKALTFTDKPIIQRSLYAFLSQQASDKETRVTASERLVALLRTRKKGSDILRRLYLEESQYAEKDNLPNIVRYTLLESALQRSEIKLASTLMVDLKKGPDGVEPVMWELRRARVFVMAGKSSEAAAVLNTVLDDGVKLEQLMIDRLMQVLFDLQTVEEHAAAYALFKRLSERVEAPQLKRELLYWMADSRKAQKNYSDAAALYLRSAEKPGTPEVDLWAQSALYQAAESLAEAGLVNDARTLYKQLLKYTNDSSRQAQLKRRLQQLWLHGKVN